MNYRGLWNNKCASILFFLFIGSVALLRSMDVNQSDRDGHGEAAEGISGLSLTPPPSYITYRTDGPGVSCKASSSFDPMVEFSPLFVPEKVIELMEDVDPLAAIVLPASKGEARLLGLLQVLYDKFDQSMRSMEKAIVRVNEDTCNLPSGYEIREQRLNSVYFTGITNAIGIVEMALSLAISLPYRPIGFVQQSVAFNRALCNLMEMVLINISPKSAASGLTAQYSHFISLSLQLVTFVLKKIDPQAVSSATLKKRDEIVGLHVFYNNIL